MPLNPQEHNVGNLGDILKHAALLQLIRFFDRFTGRKFYLDTHCYLLQARLANPDWSAEVQALLQNYPLYDDYRRLQKPYAERGEYLCSSGIVSRQSGDTELLLSESNPDTRCTLRQQLRDRGIRATVKHDMALWHRELSIRNDENIFILLDPFHLTEGLWYEVCALQEQSMSAGAQGLLLVFHYDKEEDAFAWPGAAAAWGGPAASLSRPPYHLAVYSTPAYRQAVADLLTPLGWRT